MIIKEQDGKIVLEIGEDVDVRLSSDQALSFGTELTWRGVELAGKERLQRAALDLAHNQGVRASG